MMPNVNMGKTAFTLVPMHWKKRLVQYIYIAIMGAVGAFLRALLGLLIPSATFPLSTFLVNALGCFILEIVYDYLGRRSRLPKQLVSGMGVGLVGSFTTLSAFSRETVVLLQQGFYGEAGVYITATFFACFAASLLGHQCCNLLALHRMRILLSQRRARQESKRQENGDEK